MKKGLFILTSLLMLGASVAQAQDYVLFPTSGTTTVDLSDKQEGYSMKLYENGGPSDNNSNNCNGFIFLKAPASGFRIVGSSITESSYDYLYVYNGSTTSSLLASYCGTQYVDIQANGDLLLRFSSDGSVTYPGLDLTVFVGDKVVDGDFVYADKFKTNLIKYTGGKTSVVVPSTVEEIGGGAFTGNSHIVYIPNSVKKIGQNAFKGDNMMIFCQAAGPLDGWNSNWNYSNYTVYWNNSRIPDFLYTVKSDNTVTITACNSERTSVAIPATTEIDGVEYKVTEISSTAFNYCTNLQHIEIGENIHTINSYAFQNCPNLKTVGLDDAKSLTCIGDYAFANSSIKSISIPKSVTTIGLYAFQNCINLTDIDFSSAKALARIHSYAFDGCTGLKNIDFGNVESLTRIENEAFQNCTNLETVDLSGAKNLSSVNSTAFYGCTKLTSLSSTNDGVLYSGDKTRLLAYPTGRKGEFTVPSTVTTINSYAFYSSSVTKITIPSSVTTFNSLAFCGCNSLETVDLSSARGLKTIDYQTFYACGGLKSIVIPSWITSIGNYAFYSCGNLETVDLSNATSLTSIGQYAFRYCSKLAEIDLQNATSLTSIGVYAFGNCSKLTELTFPASLTSLSSSAFQYCTSLTKADMGATQLTGLYGSTFNNCSALTDVTLPETLKWLYSAFSGYSNLKYNEYGGALYLGTPGNKYAVLVKAKSTGITECNINSNAQMIADNAFIGCTALKQINIPSSVKAIGNCAFESCTALEQVSLPDRAYISSNAFYNCCSLASVDVPRYVEAIDANAFYHVKNINYSGELGSETETWGAYARNGKVTSGYTNGDFVFSDEAKTILVAYFGSGGSIEIPESTITIDANAFVGCKGITSVVIPDNVKYVYSAFKGCTGLKTVKIGSGVTYIESNAFNGCPIETLTYNTEAISTMFAYNSTLKTVNVGDKVKTIKYQAFQGCSNLTTVNFSQAKSLTTIDGQAFYNSGLTEITIPQTVTSIGANAFAYCKNLKKVDLNNATGISVINQDLFYDCTSLESIDIPDWITDIYLWAFGNCYGLKSVTLGSGVTSIGDYAFSNCPIETLTFNTNYIGGHFKNNASLKKITAGDKVTSIPDYAFIDCTNLSEINIGSNVTSVGIYSFSNCSNITSVVTSSNADLSEASLYFTKDGIRYRVLNKNSVEVVSNGYSGRVVIPETVTAGNTFTVIGIGAEAFHMRSGLTEVVIPKTVTTIGSNAFYECYGLTEITIPESVTTIGSKAFYGCDGLLKVDLSNAKSLTRIENEAFYSCDNLAELDLENAESLNFIGNWAFAYCNSSAMTSITIPSSVYHIGSRAFNQCYNLQTVDLTNAVNLEYIGESAFAWCTSLPNIKIPASVTTIGDYAFQGCNNISSIFCEAESQPSGWYYNWNYPNNHQVIWHYNNIKVNVEANDSELGTVSGSGTYTYGDEVTISATPADGVNFGGWSDGTTNSSFTFFPTENVNITANFFIPIECVMGDNIVSATGREKYNCVFTPSISGQYTVYSVINVDTYGYLYDADRVLLTYDDDSGSGNNFQFSYNLTAGETYILGVGFYSSNVGDISFVIAGPIEIIANAENGTVDGAGTYSYGDVASLHAIPDEGYHFVKWSDGETSSWYHIDVYNDVNLTAEFAINEYEITGTATSGYGTVEGTGTYAHGSTVKLTAKPNKGYEFVEWQNDGSTVNPREFTAVNGGNYVAVMTTKTYTINTVGNNVSVNIWGDTYYGNTIELTASPNYNYNFVEWRNSKGEVLSTANPYNYTVSGDETIMAVVEGKDCTVDATMEHGTVVGTGTYKYGTTATLKAVPEPGYKFVYWENTSTSATRSFKVETTVANYTAYTMPIEYSVVVSSSDNTKGTVSSDAGSKIYYGNVVNVEATPSGSNKFVRWSDGNTTASRSITVQRDWNLTAVFSEETLYTVTATAGPNGAVTGSARYAAGEKATLTAIANVGYHFVKWSDGSTDATHVITVNGDKSLSAEFAVDTYTVTVAAGANGTVTGGGSFEFGAPATITATASAGYHFAGWSDGNTEANRTFNVSGNLNVTAAFEINTYTVKASAKNGSVEGAGTYNHGAEATLTATAGTGYHFAQWSDGNSVNPRKLTVTSDVDLKAEFDVNSYEITVAAANGTVTGAGTYNYGSVATLSATAADGYHFTKWADGVISSSRSEIVTEDKKFTAEFEVDAYNVSAYAQNGSVEGAGYYNHGASATLTAKADEGYHFIQWSDGVKDKTRTETVLSSMSFEAEFEVNTFNITAAEAANGVVSGAGTYNYGAVATLTAVANEGYHFTQWSDGLTSATRRLSVVEDAEFSASFEINSYEVKLSAENGTVSGAGTFEHGEEATISAKAAEHYHFVKWSDGNTQNPRTITVTKNRKLTALFEADLYTITVAAENGTVYGASSSFEFGAVATLTASADFGYHFEKWSDGNTDNPRSVTIDAALLSNIDKPFTAIFEKNPSYVGIEDAEAAADEVNIYAHGNTIVVENAENDILVFDAMGRMIAREAVNGDRTEIQVEGTGVYVVKTGSTSKRVMIK